MFETDAASLGNPTAFDLVLAIECDPVPVLEEDRDKQGNLKTVKVESVRYSMLTSMLLNELQKERRLNAEQTLQLREMARLTASLEKRLASVESTIAGNPPVATAYSQ